MPSKTDKKFAVKRALAKFINLNGKMRPDFKCIKGKKWDF